MYMSVWHLVFSVIEVWLYPIYNSALNDMRMGLDSVYQQTGITPDEFISGEMRYTPDMSDVFGAIMENAIIPVAVFIFAFFVMAELIQLINNGNNHKEFDTGVFVKWTMKTIVALLIIVNANVFVNGLFSIGSFMATSAVETFTEISHEEVHSEFEFGFFARIMTASGIVQEYDITQPLDHAEATVYYSSLLLSYIPLFILGLLLRIVSFAARLCVMIVVLNRIIEMVIYTVVAPLPLATFANSEFSQIGKNYLKNIGALALQGLLIAFIYTLYQMMVIMSIKELMAVYDVADFITNVMFSIVLSIVLIIMLFKSSSISKSILNAS